MAFIREVSDADVRREKAKARALRASQWWKRKLAAGRCGYCGRPTSPRQLTMDHRVPLVRGGHSTRANVVAACKPCNDAKKYLLPVEWDAYLVRLAAESEKHWTIEEGRS
jgi:5-methylcytosine-specific restriction endonuclease McrA